MSSTHRRNNTYRIFYNNGSTAIYRCAAKKIEQEFKDNLDIDFYQEEISSNNKYV